MKIAIITLLRASRPRSSPVVIVILLFLSAIFMCTSPKRCWALQPEPVVSLVSLIAEPEKYDGKVVVVTGYVSLGFERSFLFLSPYDSQEFILANALFLDLGNAALEPRRELNESDKGKRKHWEALLDHETCEVQGTFYYPKKEGGFWTGYPNGLITNITDMRLNVVHPQFSSEMPKPK